MRQPRAPTQAAPSGERIARAARQEFRRRPELARLTDEEAYVAEAMRSAEGS